MKISELNEKEILNFLMTSDFEGDYSPDELKYFLVKWRYFYRVLHGRTELLKVDLDGAERMLKEESDKYQYDKKVLLSELAQKDNLIDSIKNRELTFMERLKGKIILKNEDKEI